MTTVRAFWHLDPHNFGDNLTEWLLARYGATVERVPAPVSDFMGCGSVLDATPADYTGTVWGTGLIRDRAHPLPRATILGVRGKLTADHIGHPLAPLGDPGLLLAEHLRPSAARHKLGIVPHKIHYDHPTIRAIATDPDVILVDVRQPVEAVVAQITSCAAIVATSLHGLVTADSYGIPAAWADLPDRPLAGSRDFKFYDHETAILNNGTPNRRIQLTPDTTIGDILLTVRKANPVLVTQAVNNLHTTITETLRTWTA